MVRYHIGDDSNDYQSTLPEMDPASTTHTAGLCTKNKWYHTCDDTTPTKTNWYHTSDDTSSKSGKEPYIE